MNNKTIKKRKRKKKEAIASSGRSFLRSKPHVMHHGISLTEI
jgi:hypothetical protein